jgi:hypothetical protein
MHPAVQIAAPAGIELGLELDAVRFLDQVKTFRGERSSARHP